MTSPWPLLAGSWEELFPLRPARVALALDLSRPGGATLDAGCATGSLPRALAAQGRRAHGLDLEPAFLEVARARALAEGLDIAWHLADLQGMAANLGNARFALITCLGQTLPHLLEDGQWLDFFTQARDLLEPGGHLVIQAVHDGDAPVGQTRNLPPLAAPAGRLERRRIVASADRVRFETTFHPLEGPPQVSEVQHRRMGPGHAADLLRAAGLEPAPAWADETRAPFQAASPGWVIASRK